MSSNNTERRDSTVRVLYCIAAGAECGNRRLTKVSYKHYTVDKVGWIREVEHYFHSCHSCHSCAANGTLQSTVPVDHMLPLRYGRGRNLCSFLPQERIFGNTTDRYVIVWKKEIDSQICILGTIQMCWLMHLRIWPFQILPYPCCPPKIN